MIDLHVGIQHEDVLMLDEFLTVEDETGERPRLYHGPEDIMGTSWEQWCEAPWTFDGGDDDQRLESGYHVVIRCNSIGSALENLGWLYTEGFTLVPMEFAHQAGTVASITSSQDWSTQYLSVKKELAIT